MVRLEEPEVHYSYHNQHNQRLPCFSGISQADCATSPSQVSPAPELLFRTRWMTMASSAHRACEQTEAADEYRGNDVAGSS